MHTHTPVHAPRTARDRLRGRATRAAAETVPGAPAACCCPFEILNGSRTSGPVLPTERGGREVTLRPHSAASVRPSSPGCSPGTRCGAALGRGWREGGGKGGQPRARGAEISGCTSGTRLRASPCEATGPPRMRGEAASPGSPGAGVVVRGGAGSWGQKPEGRVTGDPPMGVWRVPGGWFCVFFPMRGRGSRRRSPGCWAGPETGVPAWLEQSPGKRRPEHSAWT